MPRWQLVDQCQSHRYQAEKCDERQPHHEAVRPFAVFIPVIHRQDEQWGTEEHLHITHQVPCLANAGILGPVCYVKQGEVPMLLAIGLIVQRLP